MKEEFNPTKKDLLNIEDRILEIRSSKNALVTRKRNLESSLTLLKEQYNLVTFDSPAFKEIKEKRAVLKFEFNKIESEIRSINEEIIYKNKLKLEIEHHVRNNNSPDSSADMILILKKLNALKNKYSEFAKDRTRVSSLRVMASELRDEIDSILNKTK